MLNTSFAVILSVKPYIYWPIIKLYRYMSGSNDIGMPLMGNKKSCTISID